MSHKSRKNKSMTGAPLMIAGAGLALLVLAAVMLLRPSLQSDVAAKTPEAQQSEEETFPEIPRVSLADSKAAFDNGTAIFIDVRDSSAYAEAHIPGALSIPLAELETRLTELDPKKWIIPYCT